MELNIHSTFISISGEVGIIPQGQLATFIRTQGCNLDCPYCDALAARASELGIAAHVDYLISTIIKNDLPVIFTGGEPLLQNKPISAIIDGLRHSKKTIQIETNGVLSLKRIKDVLSCIDCIVLDWKLDYPPPYENLITLRPRDWVKIVVSGEEQLLHVGQVISYLKNRPFNVAVSATDMFLYKKIIPLIKKYNNRTVVNVQIHKILNVE